MKHTIEAINQVIDKGPFQASWTSLQDYQPPSWYHRAKFGIFIHWGVYAVPAFGNEWYSRNMYRQDAPEFQHHIDTYGPQETFGYQDFIPMFQAEKFDPKEWADVIKHSGAQYVIPVAEHHDGFQMYKSQLSKWNAFSMGPKRDVLGELKVAFEEAGLIIGASSHRVEHWFFMSHGKKFNSDIKEPLQKGDFYWPAQEEADHYDFFSTPTPTKEFLDDWLLRSCELIDGYQPQILYFDWWIQHQSLRPYLQKLAAYYYNRSRDWGKEVVINYKHDAFMFGTAVVDIERGQFSDSQPYLWQTDTAIAKNSWCYTENNQYKQATDILCDLVDIVSKNGRLLLNIGPKADGTIPQEEQAVLAEIGTWLSINGEAIYDAKMWRKFGEGPTQVVEGQFADNKEKRYTSQDVRYTVNGDAIYGIVMKPNQVGEYCFPALGKLDGSVKPHFMGIIQKVTLLGSQQQLSWQQQPQGLRISGVAKPQGQAPLVFKIQVA